jgi:hypothetical protein
MTSLRTFIFPLLLLFPLTGFCVPDTLLEHLQTAYKDRGDNGLQEFARGLGITLRQERGVLLVPVIVDRAIEQTPQFQQKLQRATARLDARSRSWLRILVPAARLDRLLDEFPQERLRAPVPVIESSGMGAVVSESVALTAAHGYQAGNLTGAGVRVAVVDLGFTGLSARIASGELPSNTVSVDYTGTGVEATTKHGTGVAEHILDMAPGVQLYCLKVSDNVDLQNAAVYLADNNIRIANHSVSWFLASYYDDTGPINAIINDSHVQNGVFWSVASGNMARRHWRGGWLDADGDNRLEFATNDELLGISGSASPVTIFLNWNQYGNSSKTNLNLYLLDKNGVEVASSTTTQSAFNDPVEIISFTYQSAQAPYDIRVSRSGNGSTTGLNVTLFSVNHNLTPYTTASSLTDPADAHGAFAVGAVNQANWNNVSPAIESFSSQGPSTDGRLKPELVAPDGTSSQAYGTLGSSGTSFASPTVAGAAALLKQQNGTLTATQLASQLQSGAVDIGAAGSDNVFGYGKLQLPLIDSDNDLLSNIDELLLGTNPLDADSDDDNLSDYEEQYTWGTNPLLADTDADGVSDYNEAVTYNTNPLLSNLADLAPRGGPDGEINAGDFLVLARLVSGQAAATGAELVFGDLDENGMLDTGDLLIMSRLVTGQVTLP